MNQDVDRNKSWEVSTPLGTRILLGEYMRQHPPTDKSQALPPEELSWERMAEIEPRLKMAERVVGVRLTDEGAEVVKVRE